VSEDDSLHFKPPTDLSMRLHWKYCHPADSQARPSKKQVIPHGGTSLRVRKPKAWIAGVRQKGGGRQKGSNAKYKDLPSFAFVTSPC